MKGFNHLQLISIKNQIFNVPINIFLFNNWKKSNACRFLNSYALKWYDPRRLKKLFRGSNFVQKFGPSYKKTASMQTILLGLCVGSGKLNMDKITHVLMTLKTQLVLIYDTTLTPFLVPTALGYQFGRINYLYLMVILSF